MILKIGAIIAQRYKIVDGPFHGGMADVYKAWDPERGYDLAIKLMHDDLAQDKIFLRRFKREASLLAKLQHSNIVRFYDLVQDENLTFYTLDFIEGMSLREVIFKAKGSLPFDYVLKVMKSVCSALHYAHRQGVVHCDLKPGNILIDNSGKVYVTDFGIARMTEGATATMVGAGTPAYMSPEQIQGKDPTPAMDIYSLGVILFEMLTGGERPFTGEKAKTTGSTAEKVRWEQLSAPAPSPRKYNKGISLELANVVLKCLEKDPKVRFAEASELFEALQNLSCQTNGKNAVPFVESISKRETSIPVKENVLPIPVIKTRRQIKLPRSAGIMAIIVIALVGFFLATLWLSSPKPTPAIATLASTITSTYYLVSTQIPTQIPTVRPTFGSTLTGGFSGKAAFVSRQDGNLEIYLMNGDGSNQVNLTNNNTDDWGTSWSPDGQKIAFISNRVDNYPDIFVMNADGSNVQNLTNSKAFDINPAWSPDGKKIAFISDREGYMAIYVMNPDGSDPERLTYEGLINYEYPPSSYELPLSWSPDGQKIAFGSDKDGNKEIYVMNANGSNPENLTHNSSFDSFPSWSPDGEKIAFVSDRNGNMDIYMMNKDGSNQIRLTQNSANDSSPSWSPDGKKIYFYSERDGYSDFYVMNADGTNTMRFTDINSVNGYLAWQPFSTHENLAQQQFSTEAPTITSAPTASCHQWFDISYQDQGKTLCVDGKIIQIDSWSNPSGDYISSIQFSNIANTFQIICVNCYYPLLKAGCDVEGSGIILLEGKMPYISPHTLTYSCP